MRRKKSGGEGRGCAGVRVCGRGIRCRMICWRSSFGMMVLVVSWTWLESTSIWLDMKDMNHHYIILISLSSWGS